MQQVLFYLPIIDWPVYGYGMMLFLAYFFCTWLASWLAKKEGIAPHTIYDLGIWIFLCGIAGARVTFMIQYGVPLDEFWKLWEGGLVFYGSAIGGLVGYFGAYYFILRKHKISTWKMADIIAPCAALGLCLGRFGCLLNGCCYGNVACPDCPAISFPLPTEPRSKMVEMGYQTAEGFTFAEFGVEDYRRVAKVEPGSAAYDAGLRDGDMIIAIDGKEVSDPFTSLGKREALPRGKNDLVLSVRRGDNRIDLPPFVPWTIGLHPTQLYESISMALLFFVLLAYFPYRRSDGQVMVLFMLCYAVHRFLNEMLRNDTDYVTLLGIPTHMTLSQNISIVVLTAGLLLAWWRCRAVATPNVPPASA